MKKYIPVIIFSLTVLVTVNGHAQSKTPDEKTRLSKLYGSERLNDYFMNRFLAFIKSNDLGPSLVKYESFLIKNHLLKGTSGAAYKTYFINYVLEEKDKTKRCLDADIKSKVSKVFFTNTSFYKEAEVQMESGQQTKTKEFRFLTYLVNEGGHDWQRALEYALDDNDLTTTSKYFYLYCTLPGCQN